MSHLTKAQEQAVLLVHSGLEINEIAKKLDVTRQTLWNWRKLPDFKERISELFMESVDARDVALFAMQSKALETLESCLSSENESVALRAAKIVMEHGEKISINVRTKNDVISNEALYNLSEWGDFSN